LEEERIVQEAAAMQQAEQQKLEEMKRQEEATAEEEKVLQLLLENTVKQRQRVKEQVFRRTSKTTFQDTEPAEPTEDSPGTVSFDPPLTVNGHEGRPLTFRSVFGKGLIGRAHHKETFTVRPIVADNRSSAPML